MSQIFKPTYLYVKRHATTGKLYFGKTTRIDIEKYVGSGLHWKRHVREHGRQHVETIWFQLFEDEIECTEFAQAFSELFNIVESDSWLNLVIESGLSGKPPGWVPSAVSRERMSKARLGKAPPNKGIPHSKETKQRMSDASPWKGKKKDPAVIAKRTATRLANRKGE